MNHFQRRWESWAEDFVMGFIPDVVRRPLEAGFQRLFVGTLFLLLRGTFILTEKTVTSETKMQYRTRVVMDEAGRLGLTIKNLGLLKRSTNFFMLHGSRGKILFEGLPGINPMKTVSAVDDKEYARKVLRQLCVPVPEGRGFTSFKKALRYAEKIGFPVVTKPKSSSLSAHVTVNVKNAQELKKAFEVARQISHTAIVEKHIPGHLFRATTVGQKLVAIGRREPLTVTGDGRSTVEALVQGVLEENARKVSQLGYKPEGLPDVPHKHLTADLAWVPPAGKKVCVTWKINVTFGGTVHDVTGEAHPDNRALFEHIAANVKMPVLGIDFIAPDIATSWKHQPCAVIELNTIPAIDLHYPPIIQGETQDVAGALLHQALNL